MADKFRVSHVSSRHRVGPASGRGDSFQFSPAALATETAIQSHAWAHTEPSVPRVGGLLFRTANALFPNAGRLADADAAANANTPVARQSRGTSGDEIAWATIAAAIGLSAQNARAEAREHDALPDLNGPSDSQDKDAAVAPPSQDPVQHVPGPDAAPAPAADDAAKSSPAPAADPKDAMIEVASDGDLDGGAEADRLADGDGARKGAAPHHVGSGSIVLGLDGEIELGSDLGATPPPPANYHDGAHYVTTIMGTSGDDVLFGTSGNDFIDGGNGVDTVVYHGSVEEAIVTLAGHHSDNDHHSSAAGPNHDESGGAAAAPDAPGTPTQSAAESLDKHHSASGEAGHGDSHDTDSQMVRVSTATDGTDTLVNVEKLKFDDGTYTIVTADGSHQAQGTADSDIVIGSGQGDLLAGGRGDDVLVAGGSRDSAAFSGSVGGYNLSLSSLGNVVIDDQTADRDGKDVVLGVQNLSFHGAAYALTAGTSGDDILVAGAGPEILVGGAGHDVFVFNSTIMAVHRANALDMVADFSQGADRIDLHLISTDPFLVGMGSFIWDGSGTGANGHHDLGHVGYHVEQVNADWQTIIDGAAQTGAEGISGSGDFHIALRGNIDLTQADLIL